MNFDIAEIIKQKQIQYEESISTETGDEVDISIRDGKVIVSHIATEETDASSVADDEPG